MPRWGAERRARPLHEVQGSMKSWASVLPQGGRRKDARRIAFRCGPVVRLSALRLPSFKGGVFGDAFWLGFSLLFLGVGKARVRRRIATTKRLVIAGHSRWRTASLRSPMPRRSMELRGMLMGPNSTLPFSMDHRVICRQDGASRLV